MILKGKMFNKLSFLILISFFVIISLVPQVASATPWNGFGTCPETPTDFKQFVCIAVGLVKQTIIYAASCALLAFIWGLSKFILASGSEEKIADGKWIMKWGVIGLFFMFSIWGVIQVITTGIFGPDIFGLPLLPQ